MKINLKKKVMLAILAGGIFCMNGAFAAIWYGSGDSATEWKGRLELGNPPDARTTGANLTLDGTGNYGGVNFSDVASFYASYGIFGDLTNNLLTIKAGTFNLAGYNCIAVASFVVPNTGTHNVDGNKIVINAGAFNFSESSSKAPEIVAGRVAAEIMNNGVEIIRNNVIEINGGTFKGSSIKSSIVGGEISGKGHDGCIVGGTSLENGNRVVVQNAIFPDNSKWQIMGGADKTTTANGVPVQYNSVVMKDNITMGTTDVEILVFGGYSGKGLVDHNYVEIQSGLYKGVDGGKSVAGGWSDSGNATNNKVYIAGGTFAENTMLVAGRGVNVQNNEILIDNGSSFGEDVLIYGGSGSGNVEGNYVYIEGGDFNNEDIMIYGGGSTTGTANNNHVYITRGSFNDVQIYGGFGESGAQNNKVHIEGGTFGDNFGLVGGFAESGAMSGNILELETRISGKAKAIGYFQEIKFVLPDNTGEAMLKTKDMIFDNTKISVDVAPGVTLNDGSVITLIEAT